MAGGQRKPSYEQLLRRNEELSRQLAEQSVQNQGLRDRNEELLTQVEDLKSRLADLQRRFDELEATAYRQAAPFRIPEKRRKTNPGRPGRKPGHPGCWRSVPDHIDEERIVPLRRCPRCGGPVDSLRPLEQFIEDIPPGKVHVTRLVTFVGNCPRCGKVRSTHPLQLSLAGGCAKTQIGPRALGLAAKLNKDLGLTYRKTAEVLRLFGLRITAGGLSQGMKRVAGRLKPAYEQIARAIRAGPVAHADETSWYVGRPGWWLWVFAGPQHTLYAVEDCRGAVVVQRVLGEHFGGVLVSDCLASYDPIRCRKQKCYAHHLRALSESIQGLPPESGEPLRLLKVLLKTGMTLDGMRRKMPPGEFEHRAECLRQSVYGIIDAPYGAGGVEKALHRFRTHREHLFTFLDHPEVDATNNLAERQLRPAVIARKLSCGNKTASGKQTWQTLASIAATCRQQMVSFVDLVARSMPLTAPPPTLTAA